MSQDHSKRRNFGSWTHIWGASTCRDKKTKDEMKMSHAEAFTCNHSLVRQLEILPIFAQPVSSKMLQYHLIDEDTLYAQSSPMLQNKSLLIYVPFVRKIIYVAGFSWTNEITASFLSSDIFFAILVKSSVFFSSFWEIHLRVNIYREIFRHAIFGPWNRHKCLLFELTQ